jgi:hypothetical protein
MRYMMFIKHTEDYRGKTIPPGLIAAMDEFIGEYSKQGKFIDGAGLKSSHKGKRVQLRNGKLKVTDGPFTETKEIISYAVYELRSREEAVEWASRFVVLHRDLWPGWEGDCEIRRVFGPEDFGG